MQTNLFIYLFIHGGVEVGVGRADEALGDEGARRAHRQARTQKGYAT